jgi:type I restriction enzyme R subunit
VDIEHAEAMRRELANANADLVATNSKYVMQITGDNKEGKDHLDAFISPNELYPVIATTSKLMTTGVDAQTCKLIVLDSNIGSMTEFKQIIGRGTRINEDFGKHYFTIMDFRNVTALFADKDFDGDPVRVKEASEDDDISDTDHEADDMPVTDDLTGDEIDFPEPEKLDISIVNEDPPERRRKVTVNGVEVTVIKERVQYMGDDGKIITESLRDYTRKNIRTAYASLDAFLASWNHADKKRAIVEELDGPVVVAGDFNSVSSARIGRQIRRDIGLRPAPGFPGTWPTDLPSALGITIDQVYASPDLAFVSRRLGQPTGSDHRPVVTEFTRATR